MKRTIQLLAIIIVLSLIVAGCQSKEDKQKNETKKKEISSTWLNVDNRVFNEEGYHSAFKKSDLDNDGLTFKSKLDKNNAYKQFNKQIDYQKEKADNTTVGFNNEKVKTSYLADPKLKGGYDADVNKENDSEQYEEKEQASLKTMLSTQSVRKATLLDGKKLHEASYDVDSNGKINTSKGIEKNHPGYSDTPLATEKTQDGYKLWQVPHTISKQDNKARNQLKATIPKNGGLLHIEQGISNDSQKIPKVSDLAQISTKDGKTLEPAYIDYQEQEGSAAVQGPYEKYKNKRLSKHTKGKIDLYIPLDNIKDSKNNEFYTTSKVHLDAPLDKTIYPSVKLAPFEAEKFEIGKNDI